MIEEVIEEVNDQTGNPHQEIDIQRAGNLVVAAAINDFSLTLEQKMVFTRQVFSSSFWI